MSEERAAHADVRGASEGTRSASLAPYVPDVVLAWPEDALVHVVEGTLVSADLSGFTALSERLSVLGRRGAEELTDVINASFDDLIRHGIDAGGDVVSFGGDAVLTLFSGERHAERAVQASVAMLQSVEQGARSTSQGPVDIAVSIGAHSGSFTLFRPAPDQLVIAGPDASATVEAESSAGRNVIVVSKATAALIPTTWVAAACGPGREVDPTCAPVATAVAERRSVPAIDPSLVPGWLPEIIRDGGGHAEHRLVTVGFVRVTGLEALLDAEGEMAVAEALGTLGDVVRDETARHGTYWLASDIAQDGAKFIITAGAPASTADDRAALINTALAIVSRRTRLDVRVGVNHGLVFSGDLGNAERRTFTVMGDPVNLAARLAYACEAGEVLVSDVTLDDAEAEFSVRAVDAFQVKGKAEPIRASLVLARSHSAVGRSLAALGPDLQGRTAELGQLSSLLTSVRAGLGQSVAIVGPTGIGKTRLAEELVRLAPDVALAGSRARAYDANTPYAGTRDLLRVLFGIDPSATREEAGPQMVQWIETHAPDQVRWAGLMAEPIDATIPSSDEVARLAPAFRKPRVHATVVDLVREAATAPTLMLIDNAQHLDDASAQLIRAILDQLASRPWLVLVTCPADAAILDEPIEHRVSLEPLSDAASRALVLTQVGAGALHDHDLRSILDAADGNPLFLLEIAAAVRARGVGDEPPRSLEAMVTARIDRLATVSRRALRDVSVLGEAFPLSLAPIVAEMDGDAFLLGIEDQAQLGAFLVIDGDGVRFRFDLYRDVAYAGLSYRRRRELHARVAAELEARGGILDLEAAAQLAYHHAAAGQAEPAWRFAVLAGDGAVAIHANADAVDLYRKALAQRHVVAPEAGRDVVAAAATGTVDQAEVARVAEALGTAAERAARYTVAEEAFALAESLAADDALRLARLRRKRGELRERASDYEGALAKYAEARDLLDDGDDREAAKIAVSEAGIAIRQGRYNDALAIARTAAALALAAEDATTEGYALMIEGLAGVYGALSPEESDALLRDALHRFESVEDLLLASKAHNNLGLAAFYQRDWVEALHHHEASQKASEAAGDVMASARSRYNQAEILTDQGRAGDAEALLVEAIRSFRGANFVNGVRAASGLLGLARARQGRGRDGLELVEDAASEMRAAGEGEMSHQIGAMRVECLAHAGRYPEAIAAADDLLAEIADDAPPWLVAWILRSKGCAELVIEGCEAGTATLRAALASAVDPQTGGYQRGVTLLALARAGEVCGEDDLLALREEGEAILADFGVTGSLTLPLP